MELITPIIIYIKGRIEEKEGRMVVGTGNRSGETFTAADKYTKFKETVLAVVKEEKRVDEIKSDSSDTIKDCVDYWIEEYYDLGDDKKEYTKQMKELIKIRVKEIKKMDQTTRLAFENELIMLAEAGEKSVEDEVFN